FHWCAVLTKRRTAPCCVLGCADFRESLLALRARKDRSRLLLWVIQPWNIASHRGDWRQLIHLAPHPEALCAAHFGCWPMFCWWRLRCPVFPAHGAASSPTVACCQTKESTGS